LLTVGFIRRISEKRDDIILARARPHLDDGEEVIHWVRARRHGDRVEGFVYLTERRVIVHWSRKEDGQVCAWGEIRAWGVDEKVAGGPVLGIETDAAVTRAQLRVDTDGMTARVRDFLDLFGELAPFPRRRLQPSGDLGEVHEGEVEIARERRTVAAHTRRMIITIIGLALIVIAVIIIPVPGPWSFILTLGGLAILAREYDWAKDVRDWVHDTYKETAEKIKRRTRS
jgi:uncharacterized protein (TIGR02611 family)